jgi:hypothetical protein
VGDTTKSKALTIAYQGSRSGVTEPCGCHTTPYGGLDREKNAIDSLRKENPDLFYLDAGNMFTQEKLPPRLLDRAHQKAELLNGILNKMGLDVLAIGEQDYQLGVEFLKKLSKETKTAFLSTNVVDEKGEPLFLSYKIVERGGIKLGVLSASAPKEIEKLKLKATDPEAALKKGISQIKDQVDYIVVLSQLTSKENRDLAKKDLGIHMIIGCDPKESLQNPYWMEKGKALVLDPHILGYKLGFFRALMQKPFKGFYSQSEVTRDQAQYAVWKKEVDVPKKSEVAKKQIGVLEQYGQLAPIEGGSSYYNELIGLSKEEYGQPNEVTEALSKFKKSVKEAAVKGK